MHEISIHPPSGVWTGSSFLLQRLWLLHKVKCAKLEVIVYKTLFTFEHFEHTMPRYRERKLVESVQLALLPCLRFNFFFSHCSEIKLQKMFAPQQNKQPLQFPCLQCKVKHRERMKQQQKRQRVFAPQDHELESCGKPEWFRFFRRHVMHV